MTAIAERAEHGAGQPRGKDCEAVTPFIGINWPCGEPVVGLFRRACVHEHIRDGWLCQFHADAVHMGFCQACHDLDGDLAHECPIVLTGVTA